jgi:hypothetical protein
MVAQDVIRPMLLLHLHDRERQQVILAPTGPRTLSKQLYYGSSWIDVPSVTFPCVQQQQQVILAPTVHRILCK